MTNPLFPATGPATGSFNGLHPKSKFLAVTGPATGSFNGLHPKSKFLAVNPAL